MDKVRKILVILIITIICLANIQSIVYAMTNDSNDAMKLSEGKLLDRESVKKIATIHLNTYIKSDPLMAEKNIKLSDEWINLLDTRNNIFAYMIPLEENGIYIGYMNVGAILDGYDSYEIIIDNTDLVNSINELKNDASFKKFRNENKLIYLSPFTYAIEGNNLKDGFYLLSEEDNYRELKNISRISIEENYNKFYGGIRNDNNKRIIESMLSDEFKKNNPSYSMNYVQEEDYRLAREYQGGFVPVYQHPNIPPEDRSYGGDQNWYPYLYQQQRGCGPVAASNIFQYLSSKSPWKYGPLYNRPSLSKSDFLVHMEDVMQFFNTGGLGEPFLGEFAEKVRTFAYNRNIMLRSYMISSDSLEIWSLNTVASVIKDGLRSDSPVATLNWKWTYTDPSSDVLKYYNLGRHWMTITKYYRNIHDSRWVAVSSWGMRGSLNYYWLYDAMCYGGGVIFFE